MARPLVRLRNSPDFRFLVDLDIDLLCGVVPIFRVAPPDAFVPIVEVQVFVCFVHTPGNVAGARASDEIPVVYPIVPFASADAWIFVLAGESPRELLSMRLEDGSFFELTGAATAGLRPERRRWM